jgi:hypothetical protein
MSGRVAEQHCNVGGRENTKRSQDKPNKQSLGGKTERTTVMTESVSDMREMIIKSWGIKGRSSYNPNGHLHMHGLLFHRFHNPLIICGHFTTCSIECEFVEHGTSVGHMNLLLDLWLKKKATTLVDSTK